MKKINEKQLDRIRGALYGVAVGDALGGPLEFMSDRQICDAYGRVTDMIGGGWLNLKPGEVTDDTQMTLCVARGILDALEGDNGLDLVASVGQQFIAWADSKPKDIGGACSHSIAIAKGLGRIRWQGVPTAADWMEAARQTRRDGGRPVEGNGALMRTVYPGLYCKTKGAAEMQARAFAEMTHRGDKSTEACVLYTRMVYLLTESVGNFQDGDVADFLHECLKGTFYDGSVEAAATYAAGGYVVDSMSTAVSCLAHAQTFEEAVCAAANLGGDTDTNAAITGGLAGAWFGFSAIPARWVDALAPGLRQDLDILAAAAESHRNQVTGGKAMPYGRPMKGASRRVPTTVHIPTGTLDIIDNYIDDREKNVETGRMSRSDFINEAVNRYLVELGLVEPESNTEVTPK